MSEIIPAQQVYVNKLLQDLLCDIDQSYADEGFSGPIYHYYFRETAKAKVTAFLERVSKIQNLREANPWVEVAIKPEPNVPIEMTGDSGYIAPHDRFLISGYYDPEFRPRSPWLDSTSTCLEDSGWVPTHWRRLSELPKEKK